MEKKGLIGILVVLIIALVGGFWVFCFYYLSPESPAQECANEGESYSTIFIEDYPEKCCEGLTEWEAGMDTSISVADVCYSTMGESGWPVGKCINCGNGICEDIENPCNCLEDCLGEGKSTYISIENFCDEAYEDYCEGMEEMDLDLCSLCSAEN